MATIHVDSRSRTRWIGILLATAVAAGLGYAAYQGMQADSPPSAPPPVAVESAAPVVMAPSESVPQALAPIMAEQAQAARVIEQQPAAPVPPGPVTERPEYVSRMVWAMLQGVAQQHANPEQELTRLVHSLRFNKQLELWQALTGPEDATQRQALARQLLIDLPDRLTSEEMDAADARKLQASLLQDAYPDPAERARRTPQEAQRLERATPAPTAR